MNDFKCGILAGTISTLLCNPLDVIRTHYQTNTPINQYNFRFFYRGIKYSLFTIPSFWSIYFPSYNLLKNEFKFKYTGGYLAGNLASTITCPLFFIKQKNQLYENFDIIKFYKKNGFTPFYNALISTYLVNTSLLFQMPLYEYFQTFNQNSSVLNTFLITLFSKTFASSITYPFDTIRSIKREKFQKSNYEIIKNLSINYKNFYKGFNIYLLRSLPYHTSIFCIYEFLKE